MSKRTKKAESPTEAAFLAGAQWIDRNANLDPSDEECVQEAEQFAEGNAALLDAFICGIESMLVGQKIAR